MFLFYHLNGISLNPQLTALSYAEMKGHKEIAALLEAKSREPTKF